MDTKKLSEAEEARYRKIERLTALMCDKDNNVLDALAKNAFDLPIKVGSKITIDGENITIKNAAYSCRDILKVTINTEGSMNIYHRDGKKLCGTLFLNTATDNVEMFCLWVRKYGVPCESVSGKAEMIFQWTVAILIMIAAVAVKILHTLIRH